ncbi:MAG TPA: hypothetical protein EYM37_11920 [Methylophaga aminisulfidivorans]|uniref:hypothetical protein n=1 Tax=Methylophaga TaxID=40222 RepID=UPI0017670EDF|nr:MULTISPECIES: hypothetical protein [Methylophaga]HIC47265.1 hypothetical protein [Methylophaga sp.]HIM40619.1 hypothetical protein [Methylophaga aminisulfidivorans]
MTDESTLLALEKINNKIDRLGISIEKTELSEKKATGKFDESIWTTITKILGIPAIVIAIMLQFNQAEQSDQDTIKSVAETQKILTEEVKTRVEIEKMLNELADNKTKSVEDYQKQIEEALPKIKQAVQELDELDSKSQQFPLLQSLLIIFVVLWILHHGIHIVFSIVEYVWSSIITLAVGLTQYLDHNSKFKRRLMRGLATSIPVLYPLAGVVRWGIELSVFILLLIPFFDYIALNLGVDIQAKSIIESAANFQIKEAIEKVKVVIDAAQP